MSADWASAQPKGELRRLAIQQADLMEEWPKKKVADGPHE